MNLAPALIQDASSGDQQAFVLLVEPLLPDAFRLAVGILRSESDAEDAVQEGVLNAWRHFGRFRPGSDLRPPFRSDQAGLANCLACQTLAGSGQAPCNVGDDFCQNNIVVAMEDIDALQGDLVRNFAPAASAPKDARLQIDVWAADQALVAMGAAWSAHDQVSLQTARDAFSQAFTRVVSDLAAL